MRDVREWWNHFTALLFGAIGVWVRVLPQLIAVNALGHIGLDVALIVAPAISGGQAWLAVVVLAFGLVLKLSAVIVSLRLIGRELNVSSLLPEGAVEDDRESSAANLIAITLLPFLGIYSVFGRVQDVINSMVAHEIVVRGLGERSVMSTLSPHTKHQYLVLVCVVIGAYLVRRGVDLLHEKTDFRPLGLLAAMIEAFFMLVFLFSGTQMITRIKDWLVGRRLADWWNALSDGWHTSASSISHYLPSAVGWLWTQLTGVLWPLFKAGLAEPLLWLAVAALIYGSHVLSLAELWRKGEPLSVHLDRERTIALARRAQREQVRSSSLMRRVWLETQEAFFGDVDDKYLPTLQSLRLVLRTGLPFLGAYVLAYALISSVGEAVSRAIYQPLGGGDSVFWVAWLRLINLVVETLSDSLTFALLAVAFARCLRAFRSEADPTTLTGDPEAGLTKDELATPTGAPA